MSYEVHFSRKLYERAIRRACTIDDFPTRDVVASVIGYTFKENDDTVHDDLDAAYVKGSRRLLQAIFGRKKPA